MRQNPHFPDFAIFRDEAGRGGFRGPSQPLNGGGLDAERHRKSVSENIAHSLHNLEIRRWFLSFLNGNAVHLSFGLGAAKDDMG